jgi:cytochrome b involved in lipid metabolism
MTRKLFLSASAVFWLAVAGFWISELWSPEAQESVANAAERRITLKEVAQHASTSDCWMAIRGAVYDLSAYLPQHPSPPELVLSWCGKEATDAYNTKTKGRPHSPYADELLVKYRIGTLDAAVR